MRSGAWRALIALLAMATSVGAACGHAPPPATVGAGLRVYRPQPPSAVTPAAAEDAPQPSPVPMTAAPRRAAAAQHPLAPPVSDARILIPRIGVDLPVYEGVDPWTLRFGPGHWEGTVAPGEVGNTVVAGHRTTFTHPFRDIDQIEAGDDVIFVTNGGTFTYHATDAFVVGDTDTWIADATDTATFTLFACHPKGSERERYVLKGELVRSETASDQSAQPAPAPSPSPSQQPPPSSQRHCLLCGGH
jgi:sortase A